MKKILVIILIFCAGYTHAQDKKQKMTFSSFSVETNSLDELKNYDWKSLKKIFKGNEKNDSIQIKLCLNCNDSKASEDKLNLISTTIKGKTYELKKMIRTARRMIKEIIKIKKDLMD